jgi:hypothetical protein
MSDNDIKRSFLLRCPVAFAMNKKQFLASSLIPAVPAVGLIAVIALSVLNGTAGSSAMMWGLLGTTFVLAFGPLVASVAIMFFGAGLPEVAAAGAVAPPPVAPPAPKPVEDDEVEEPFDDGEFDDDEIEAAGEEYDDFEDDEDFQSDDDFGDLDAEFPDDFDDDEDFV